MTGPPAGTRRRTGEKSGRRGGERPMVPEAEFRSYYGRPVLKKPVWKWDIPAYFLTGGVMAGSSLLAAGADLTANGALRRAARLAAAANLGASTYFLIHDLGRPERFLHMLRVLKPTSPMSVGTWMLAAYGPPAGLAALSEATGRLPRAGRAAGLLAAVTAPVVAAYTAVLTADTAVPSWHDAYRQLPFVFVGSAGAAAGGLAMALVPPNAAGPARRLAVLGAAVDLVAAKSMETGVGLAGEPYHVGSAGRLSRWARRLTAGGAVVAAVLGRRSRLTAIASGAALVAGSACTRFAVFHAGVQSAVDPKYTVVPQRARGEAGADLPSVTSYIARR
ncbi:MAG: polysulfide reductase NrfD [Actinomycetota bacterium]|nr:polysulfide reductase NrfD [Actinomycetota bacterium]